MIITIKLPWFDFDFFKAPYRNQYLAVFIANLVTLNNGVIIGWLSPALLILESENTPLNSGPLTPEQVSWMASAINIGALAGILIFDYIISKFGSRIALIFLGPSSIIWWVLVAIGDEYVYLVIGRLVVGVAVGAIFRVIPHYVADISQNDIRGRLGAFAIFSYNAGILLGFVVGGYVTYRLVPIIVILPILYMFLVIFFIPETPVFLMKTKQDEKAFKSLQFYRTNKNVTQSLKDELMGIKELQDSLQNEEKVSWKAYFTKEARFGLSMSIFLSILFECSGAFPLIQFTAPVLKQAGSSLDPNDAAIIVAVVQILGNCASMPLIDRAGRKILLLVSCFGTAVSLSTLGVYSYLNKNGFEVQAFSWVPVVSFSAGIFLASIGLLALPFLILAEILPPEIRNGGLTISAFINVIFGFINTSLFPILMVKIFVHGIMWYFSVSCIIGLIVCAIFLPETKGKNLNIVAMH